MDKEIILELVKARIGITSKARDKYLTFIVDGVISELEDVQGLVFNEGSPHQVMFVVDFAQWRYSNRDTTGNMPRHLQFRLHNLIINVGDET